MVVREPGAPTGEECTETLALGAIERSSCQRASNKATTRALVIASLLDPGGEVVTAKRTGRGWRCCFDPPRRVRDRNEAGTATLQLAARTLPALPSGLHRVARATAEGSRRMHRGIGIPGSPAGWLLLAGWLALMGCRTTTATSEARMLVGTSWTLSSLPCADRPSAANAPPSAGGASARFEVGRIAGSDGCNRYSASYTETGSTIEIDPRMVSTRMACPPEVMEHAAAFTSALARARHFRIDADRLELRSESDELLATFVRDGHPSAAN